MFRNPLVATIYTCVCIRFSKAHQPESREAGQWPPAVRSPSLLPEGLWAGGSSTGGAYLQRLSPFLPNLGFQFCHQLVKVLTSAHHLPPLVDRVYLRNRRQGIGS